MGCKCMAYLCDVQTVGEVLCWSHRHRLLAGGGLPTGPEFGTYGHLTDAGLGFACHECGQEYPDLGVHAVQSHQLEAETYRRRHGLIEGLSLQHLQFMTAKATASQSAHRLPCYRCRREMTAKGDLCGRCQKARKADIPRTPPRRALRLEERADLLAADAQTLATLVPFLQLDGIPSVDIASALGRSAAWMTRRYPRSAAKTLWLQLWEAETCRRRKNRASGGE